MRYIRLIIVIAKLATKKQQAQFTFANKNRTPRMASITFSHFGTNTLRPFNLGK